MGDEKKDEEGWLLALRAKLARLPDDYGDALAELRKMRQVFHREIGAAFAPKLNEHVMAKPQADLAAKRDIAHEVNRDVREIGLAIRCPKTGAPATMVAGVRADSVSTSIFRLQTRPSAGAGARITTFQVLPSIDLVPDPPRKEWASEAFEARVRKSSGPARADQSSPKDDDVRLR